MSIIIERKKFYGFADHDCQKLKKLSIQGKIIWFQYRINKILLNPIRAIERIVKKEEKKCLKNRQLENEDVSIFTIVVLSICVGIDLLGGFFAGIKGDNNNKTFKDFVDTYLDSKNEYSKKRYKNIDKYSFLLYKLFRCGLAHNLQIKEIGFTYGEEYFRKEKKAYYISVNKLYADLQNGFANYITDIKNNKNGLKQKFKVRFNQVFIKKK